jgi:hypothetical protein
MGRELSVTWATDMRWMACALALLAGTRAAAAVQVEPAVGVAVEGGYDSNVLYAGRGGDRMGRVSPDLRLVVRDHTWRATAAYGTDIITYPTVEPGPTWNQRGRLDVAAQFTERTRLTLRFGATYAPDPAGLAQLGIVGSIGSAAILRGDARLAWLQSPRTTLALTWSERGAWLEQDAGMIVHAPGAEVAYQLDRRLQLATAYRFDYFQSLEAGIDDTTAHEARGIARWRWSRRLTLEAEAGPTVWVGPDETALIPAGGLRLLVAHRAYDLRIEGRHGLGLSVLARPSLADSFEVGAVVRLGRSFRVRGDAGLWHSGEMPDGANSTLGYGVGGEFTWLATRGIEMGIAGSRFARLDERTAETERNVIGLRVAWQHEAH